MSQPSSSSAVFNEDGLILSPNYEAVINDEVLPFLSSVRQEITVTAYDGASLACAVYTAQPASGTVLLVHGFTENYDKYAELIYSLLLNGFSVVAYDQRGHGRSWKKPGLTDTGVTHVDHFSDYVSDLETVCSRVLSGLPQPWMVFAYSMGGAVTALFLEKRNDIFSRAVLNSPMIAPNLSGVPYAAAAGICHAARLVGKGARRVFFSKPYSGPEDFATSAATDPIRFAWYDRIKATHPEFQNNSPTYTWTLEAMRVTKRILAKGAPESIRCPVLLFTADRDGSVMPEPQKQFIARVKNGKHVFVAGSRHEIYRSVNDVLFPWWHTVLTFLKEQSV